jgi:phage gpG-like protein
MPKLSIEILGKKKVLGILSTLGNRVKNLKPAFKDISSNFLEVEKRMFVSGGRPARWKPLNEKYAQWKNKHYPGKPTMILTGDLKNSLISRGGDHIERIGRMSLEVGTKDPKGDWHQTGAGNLPVRKVISPIPRDVTEWVNITRSFIIEKLGFKRSAF